MVRFECTHHQLIDDAADQNMRTDVDARTEVKSNLTLHGLTHIGRSLLTCQENSIIPSEGELVSPKNLYLLIASKCISQVEKKELPGAPGGIFYDQDIYRLGVVAMSPVARSCSSM